MNIVFLGASQLGFECCKTILEAGWKDIQVSGIFTIPETFEIRYKKEGQQSVTNVLYKDFNQFEREFGIPVIEVNQDLKEHFTTFCKWDPDLIICVGWYYLIPNEFIKQARLGAAGIHGSLLPKYRGNAPLVWAMINGEKETGVTLFYFDNGIDTGDIIGQKRFSINTDDTISSVLDKAKECSKELLLEQIPLMAIKKSNRTPQDHNEATVYPRRTPIDGEIDWNWENERIRNFIRAQTKPYPGAFTIINGKKVVIWDADILIP